MLMELQHTHTEFLHEGLKMELFQVNHQYLPELHTRPLSIHMRHMMLDMQTIFFQVQLAVLQMEGILDMQKEIQLMAMSLHLMVVFKCMISQMI